MVASSLPAALAHPGERSDAQPADPPQPPARANTSHTSPAPPRCRHRDASTSMPGCHRPSRPTVTVALTEAIPPHRFPPAGCHTRSRDQQKGRRPQRAHAASASQWSPAATLDASGKVWHPPPTSPGDPSSAPPSPPGTRTPHARHDATSSRASVVAVHNPTHSSASATTPPRHLRRLDRWSCSRRPPHSQRRSHPHRAWRATVGSGKPSVQHCKGCVCRPVLRSFRRTNSFPISATND